MSSYAAAIDALNALAPELYTQPGRPRRKFSLDELRVLLAELGNPHQKFPSVLIAGTNGKGSTAATLAAILQAAGLATGLYTSPHLERPNERIRIHGADVSDEAFARAYFTVNAAAGRLVAEGKLAQSPSFFEILTAMAFLAFAEAPVEIAVLEVGLGGRLDATNVVEPLVSVITDIALDHMEWLGSTISAIAREKAGILRRHGVLVTLPQHPQANQAIGEIATELEVRGVSGTPYMPPLHAPPDQPYPVEVLGAEIVVDSPLHGAHQHRNVALAIATAAELAREPRLLQPGGEVEPGTPRITPQAIADGIRNTQWPGRLELLTTHIGSATAQWLLDVAHNPAGVWALRSGLNQMFSEAAVPQVLVFGCLQDKPLAEMSQVLFPLFAQIVFAPIASPRAAAMDDLVRAASATGTPALAAPTMEAALQTAIQFAGGRPIVISGSVYLVGAARALLLGHAPAHASAATAAVPGERAAS